MAKTQPDWELDDTTAFELGVAAGFCRSRGRHVAARCVEAMFDAYLRQQELLALYRDGRITTEETDTGLVFHALSPEAIVDFVTFPTASEAEAHAIGDDSAESKDGVTP